MARGPTFSSAELKSLPVLNVHIPPMPGGGSSTQKRTHVFNVGQNPEKYTVGALKKKRAGSSDRIDFFEKTLLALWLATGKKPIPYAFRTASDESVRSLDAGCLGVLINQAPSRLEVSEVDPMGNIRSVIPSSALRSRHQYLTDDNLRKRVEVPEKPMAEKIVAQVDEVTEPDPPTQEEDEPLGFDPFAGFDERVKIISETVRRDGQKAFTDAMRRSWGGQCPVTKTTVKAVLDGAHIYRYGGEATNDHRNGLLLRADIHRLFDLHLVSFSYDGPDLVFHVTDHPQAGHYAEYDGLRISGDDLPQKRPHPDVIRQHHEKFQDKEVTRLAKR